MDAEGVTLRPIQLIDGGYEVNEVFFEDVRVPAENLVGEENAGLELCEVPARQRAGRGRAGRCHQASPCHARRRSRRRPGRSRTRSSRRRSIQLENELLALELTALRVVANSADGKPHPASSVLKLKGTEIQQAVSELLVDLGGSLALASGATEGSDIPDWARVAVPTYLNLRKASIYGGSNEIQRQIIAGTILGL